MHFSKVYICMYTYMSPNVHQLPPNASPSSQKCSFLVNFEEYSQKCTNFKNSKSKSIIFKSVFLPECASATTRCITIPPKVQPAIFNIEIQMKRGEMRTSSSSSSSSSWSERRDANIVIIIIVVREETCKNHHHQHQQQKWNQGHPSQKYMIQRKKDIWYRVYDEEKI